MALHADLLDILACPSDDHAPLREDHLEGKEVLVCTFCAASFPIDDGIPVLLMDEATPGPNGLGNAAGDDARDPAAGAAEVRADDAAGGATPA